MNPEYEMQSAARCLKAAALMQANDDPDSACNRAYYAMFYASRAALYIIGQPKLAAGKTHSGLISSFSEHLVKAGHFEADYGRLLSLESKRRMVCDYHGELLDAEGGVDSIANAIRFVSAVADWIARRSPHITQ